MENKINPLNNDVISLVKTKKEALYFLEILKKLSDTLFNTKTNVNQEIEKYIPYSSKEKFISLLQKNNIDTQDVAKTHDFLVLLQSAIEKIPFVTLRIAFEPNQDLVENISDWFLMNLKKPFLLDIVTDKTIIAGTLISFKGIYKDYSLKKLLEKQFNNNNESTLPTGRQG